MKWVPLCLLLVGCAPSVSLLKLPTQAPQKPVQVTPICPGSMTAGILPPPPVPDGAGFPRPTVNQSEAVQIYLGWLSDYSHWAKTGWQRAADAQAFCNHPQ